MFCLVSKEGFLFGQLDSLRVSGGQLYIRGEESPPIMPSPLFLKVFFFFFTRMCVCTYVSTYICICNTCVCCTYLGTYYVYVAHMCVCEPICMWAHMYMVYETRVCLHTHACMCLQMSKVDVRNLLQSLLPYVLRQSLSINPRAGWYS